MAWRYHVANTGDPGVMPTFWGVGGPRAAQIRTLNRPIRRAHIAQIVH